LTRFQKALETIKRGLVFADATLTREEYAALLDIVKREVEHRQSSGTEAA
jgi:hypothetical protein